MNINDPLREKHRRLLDLIWQRRQAQIKALQQDPYLDARVLDRGSKKTLAADIAKMSEAQLDELIEHHAPSAGRYVW